MALRPAGSLQGALVPVILGGGVNGLGLARSFAEIGLRSIVLDCTRSVAFASRFVSGRLCPHPVEKEAAFLDFLDALGRTLRQRGFILCTNDIWLIPVSRNQARLESAYVFPMSPWAVIRKAMTKSELYAHAAKAGIPHPASFVSSSLDDLRRIRDVIDYPCVLKPSVTVGFLEALGGTGRTLVIDSRESFDGVIDRIREKNLGSFQLIVQEQIPGGPENLYTITTYSNRSGEIVAYSTGHKIRQYPPDAGTIVVGRVTHEPRLYDLGARLIRSLGFYGIANTEFKRDPRDGEFKLIEINPRPGMWNYSAHAAGINLPALAYREALGEQVSFVGGTQRELLWLRSLDDMLNCFYLYRKAGYPSHALSFRSWLRSIRGPKVDAVFRFSDPGPFAHEVLRLVAGGLRVARRKLSGAECQQVFAKPR